MTNGCARFQRLREASKHSADINKSRLITRRSLSSAAAVGDGHRPVGIYDVAPRLRRQTDDRRANEQRSIDAKKGKTVVSARCDRRSSAEDTC